MTWVLAAMAIWIASGALALAARSPRRGGDFGAGGAVLGSAVAAVPVLATLAGHAPAPVHGAWSVPYGSFSLALDGLSAVFALPLLLLAALCAVYGRKYLLAEDRLQGGAWLSYNLLVACMAGVLCARNGVLFLVAWESMALFSYLLVVHRSERPEIQRSGRIYLVAAHLGSMFLLPMFVLLAHGGGTLDFDRLAATGSTATAIGVLAGLGFGSKAGFLPLHVWLPEAHPAAPSHVSALMSGIMIELGLYGLLRIMLLVGRPGPFWGWALLAIGLASGLGGVVATLVQRDLKRLLAFSSVENVGIVAMGLGMGLLGRAENLPVLAVFGFAGALLHVLNHAVFKGLLFLGAGAVDHATGTRLADRLGGLIKTMPRTTACVLVGGAALAGVPPLCGFAGEFAIGLGALQGALSTGRAQALPLLMILAGLALMSGIALASVSGIFGVAFLGRPRTQAGRDAHDPGLAMQAPMTVLAALCAAQGIGAPWIALALAPEVAQLSGLPPASVLAPLGALAHALAGVELTMGVMALALAALWVVRRRLLSSRRVEFGPTWGCGYLEPGPQMQYTFGSFAMPLASAFGGVVGRHDSLASYFKAYGALRRLAGRMRVIQRGNLQVYVLYIALTVLTLLVAKLGLAWR